MEGPGAIEVESVGAEFRVDLLTSARDRTLRVIEQASREIGPGMSEEAVKQLIKDLLLASGCEKSWHAPQVRFGINTLRAFGETGDFGVTLQANDLYFLDLGAVFAGHEGDVGRTFAVGSDPDMLRIVQDVALIWAQVRDHWAGTGDCGAQLYAFAGNLATERGWLLSLHEANGHRIADFPHAAKRRGSVEGLAFRPSPNKWILEIQLRHPSRAFGAFYEDLLN